MAFSLNNKQRKKGSKRIQMIIKMVTEFKLTVVNFARPNQINQIQICACAGIYRWKKKLRKIRSGPPGSREPWAVGLLLAKPRIFECSRRFYALKSHQDAILWEVNRLKNI